MQTEHYTPSWADTEAERQHRHEQRKRRIQGVSALVQECNRRRQQAERLWAMSWRES